MDQEDIKEIIKIQLDDVGIEYNDLYLEIAISYFNEKLDLPPMDYLLNRYTELSGNQYAFLLNNGIPIQIIDHIIEQNNAAEADNLDDAENDSDSEEENTNDANPFRNLFLGGTSVPMIGDSLEAELSRSGTDRGNGSASDNSNENDQNDTISLRDVIEVDSEHADLLNAENNIPESLNDTRDIDVKKVLINIESIPLIFIKNECDLSDRDRQCLTCYDNFVETDLMRELPCLHKFHRRCIDEYLVNESHLCPLCREPVGEYKLINI